LSIKISANVKIDLLHPFQNKKVRPTKERTEKVIPSLLRHNPYFTPKRKMEKEKHFFHKKVSPWEK